MTTELEEARASACRLMLECTRLRDALQRIVDLRETNPKAAYIADIVLMGYEAGGAVVSDYLTGPAAINQDRSMRPDPDDWSEEDALEAGEMSCAECEQWGTVPGSTRCEDCQEEA